MELAIEQAQKGAGKVSPNPLVGCVIVDKNHRLLSMGFHGFYGGKHAEIAALDNLIKGKAENEKLLKDTHFYVTLEPCAHKGKTSSCAKTLAQWPLKKLTYGLEDPNPLVKGKGAKILKDAGIEVEHWQEVEQWQEKEPPQDEGLSIKNKLKDLIETFAFHITEKKLFVALKVATSLDGQMALSNGESRWITNEKSRNFSHELRARYDAVLVGRQTVELDNPKLNVRCPQLTDVVNKVVVLDPKGQLADKIQNLNISQVRPLKNIYLCVAEENFAEQPSGEQPSGFCKLKIKTNSQGQFDLNHLSHSLMEQNIHSVFVEGGSSVLSSFLREDFYNRLHLFMAPTILGAGGGLSWTQGVSLKSLKEKHHFQPSQWTFLDGDFYGSFKYTKRRF